MDRSDLREPAATSSTPSRPDPFRPEPELVAALRRRTIRRLQAEGIEPGERWIVAFSGGTDSSALATLLAGIAPRFDVELALVHVDHSIDAGSAARAERARGIADRLELPLRAIRADVPGERHRKESLEAAARRLRYRELETARRALGASRILTAHQRDDQIETLLLQLERGAPIERLQGIPARRGAIWRPLLDAPRAELRALLESIALEPVDDPTNLDLEVPRNRIRHALLPALRAADPEIDAALLGLARRAAALDRRLAAHWRAIFGSPGPAVGAGPAISPLRPTAVACSFPLDALTTLPEPLRPIALRWLLTQLGSTRHPSGASIAGFLARLAAGRPAALELEEGRSRLVTRRDRLAWSCRKSPLPPFAYTFSIPGEVELPELGLRLRVGRSTVEPWMLQGDRNRVGFSSASGLATVRSRQPGDRMRPLGAPGHRKLKSILIDRGVPEEQRGRLPLLLIDGELAWVPGVAIAERFALRGASECWLAELVALPESSGTPAPVERTES